LEQNRWPKILKYLVNFFLGTAEYHVILFNKPTTIGIKTVDLDLGFKCD